MRKCVLLLTLILAGCQTTQGKDEPKMVEEVLETNSWQTAVSNFERGLYQAHNWANITAVNYGSLCITNGLYYGGASIQFEDGIILGKCGKEHIDDYPKKSQTVQGVQWRREYVQEIVIGDETNSTRWIRYSYPHEKITKDKKIEIKYVTTVTTNIVETTQPVKCEECGKDK